MNEEEKETIELDIEAKYVDNTEKEFLSRVTYAECLYILAPENEYCDKIRELSVLKLCEIIEKLQKENEKLKLINQSLENTKDTCPNMATSGIRCNLKNSIPKQVIRDKIQEYRDKRNKLSNGHFWDNPSNINEDMSLFVAIETLKELLGE